MLLSIFASVKTSRLCHALYNLLMFISRNLWCATEKVFCTEAFDIRHSSRAV